jgi:hypothetical protein
MGYIRIDFKEGNWGWEGVDWICVALETDQWLDL